MNILLSLLVCLLPFALSAQSPTPDAEQSFLDVAKELRCPTCTGLSVLDSDASFSVQIKTQVREQLAAGKSREEILSYFMGRYGPWILREPPREGFNALAWNLPIALLVGGPILIWFFVWRRRVDVSTGGVRHTEAIIAEMEQALVEARAKGASS